ncbi:MAG: hypothetical protein ABOK23_08015 [Candidatus Methanoperedens sp.]|nr:hypothetical protein [Candidatus Methanoperedens sp.]MCZ7396310.1 hypothetical protein [Candidatus Methanoperedens sp.]
MKAIRYITSVQIQNPQAQDLNISLGFEKNGAMRLCFQDTAELGQDSNYLNETSFPNSGLISHGKCSMWLSMFGRHIRQSFDDDEIG